MLQNIFKILVGGETKYLNCSIYLFQRKQWKNSKYPEDKAQSEFRKFFPQFVASKPKSYKYSEQ